jgi:type IV pilus assembly protein PilQ
MISRMMFYCGLGIALSATIGWAQESVPSDTPASASVDPVQGPTDGGLAAVGAVDFTFAPERSKLEIQLSKDATFEKQISEQDKQVIIEIKGATISKKFARKLDTSSFKTNVVLVSPYQSSPDTVRVVLQLRDPGDVEVSLNGTSVLAMIPNMQSSESAVGTTQTSLDSAATADIASPTPDSPPISQTGQDNLEAYVENSANRRYSGRKIVMQLQEADIHDVFRVISEASEFNVVVGDEVKGKVSLNLNDVPWDQALDIILHSNKLAAERNGNVLRITTLEGLTKEKEAEAAAKKAAELAEPLVVKIFPISYGKIDEIQKILKDFLAGAEFNNLAGTNSNQTNSRGSIQIDTRTNSLIVRDTASSIEKIKRVLKELDVQTPQILIEAKFVSITENRQKEMQGRLFGTSREFDANANQFVYRGTRNNFGGLFGGSQFGNSGGLPTGFAITPIAGASFGFQPKAGILPGLGEIGAFLSILETESSAKVISSPRVITQNKEAAEISQGQTLQVPTVAGPNAAGGFLTVNAVRFASFGYSTSCK